MLIALEAGTLAVAPPAVAQETVKLYVVPLPTTPITLGEQLPDTASALALTPLTTSLNTTVTLYGFTAVELPFTTVPLIELTTKGGPVISVRTLHMHTSLPVHVQVYSPEPASKEIPRPEAAVIDNVSGIWA